MVRVHGDFTGRMAMWSGKMSKAILNLFVFSNSAINSVIYYSYLIITSEKSTKNKKRVGMIVRTMISFFCVILNYSNDS